MGLLRSPARQTWRLALANVAVGIAVFVILAVSPAPVTFPSTHWEAVLLVGGALVLLLANGFVAAAAAASEIRRVREADQESAELHRLRDYEYFHVTTPEGVIGVLAEVLANREGEPAGLVVADGWFGARRFLVPVDDVVGVSTARREVQLRPLRDAASDGAAGASGSSRVSPSE